MARLEKSVFSTQPRVSGASVVEIVDEGRKGMALRIVMHQKRRAQLQAGAGALDRGDQNAGGIFALARVDRRDLDAAETPPAGGDDFGNRLGPCNQRELATGDHDGASGPDPAFKQVLGHRMGFRLQGIRRLAITGIVEGRVHDDVVKAVIGEAGSDTGAAGQGDIGLNDFGTLGKVDVFCECQALASVSGHIGRALDQSNRGVWQTDRNGKACGSCASAEIGHADPTIINDKRREQHGVHAGPVAASDGLNEMEAATMESVHRFLHWLLAQRLSTCRHGDSVLAVAQFCAQARIGQNAARLVDTVGIHQQAALQHAERSFQNAHGLIGDHRGDPGVAHQAFGKGEQDDVIAANDLMHGFQNSLLTGKTRVTPRTEAIRPLPWPSRLFMVGDQTEQESGALGVVIPLEESKNKQASVKPLVDLTKSGMERVNQLILSKAGSDVQMIPEVANHLISSGGKRLRPMLTLATAAMFGYEGDHHIKLATSVEFMHTATLLHDDVVDESDLRRGKSTARTIWGNQASVLVGDFLLGQAFRMMVEVGSLDALDVLSTAACVIAEGEVLQLSVAKNMETTEDDYLAVIRAKTAALFAAAAEVGPIVAGTDKATRSALKSYGMNLGLAFQLVDDVLDYGGKAAETGKNVGDDFREGKITLPVILSYRRGTAAERDFWKESIEGGQNDDVRLEKALGLIGKYGALNDTIQRAQHYGKIARDALAPLPNSPWKDALNDVIDFCISRVN